MFKSSYFRNFMLNLNTVVPGFRVLGFSALPGFRALKAGDGAWSVHKTLFGFRAPLSQLLIKKILVFYCKRVKFCSLNSRNSLPEIIDFFTKIQESSKSIDWLKSVKKGLH